MIDKTVCLDDPEVGLTIVRCLIKHQVSHLVKVTFFQKKEGVERYYMHITGESTPDTRAALREANLKIKSNLERKRRRRRRRLLAMGIYLP